MALKPLVERLEVDLGNRAAVLRVSIHTKLGKALGQRYTVEDVPLFILFNEQGKETKRIRTTPAISEVLREG
ncbi:MAG: hypothetical protein IT324_25510 [Anaerolineae bacterium]|nr:hypothetical protein [Anaerolineae bacterium]